MSLPRWFKSARFVSGQFLVPSCLKKVSQSALYSYNLMNVYADWLSDVMGTCLYGLLSSKGNLIIHFMAMLKSPMLSGNWCTLWTNSWHTYEEPYHNITKSVKKPILFYKSIYCTTKICIFTYLCLLFIQSQININHFW